MINNVFNAKGDKMFYQHFSKKMIIKLLPNSFLLSCNANLISLIIILQKICNFKDLQLNICLIKFFVQVFPIDLIKKGIFLHFIISLD
jgi:hypothetical protein